MTQDNLTFGIYPGGAAGGDSGLLTGPADDPAKITELLDQLQGATLPFVVRCYDSFQDPDSPFGKSACAPQNYAQYARKNRPLDLVLQFRSASGNLDGYLDFIRAKIREHHAALYSVQIAEEPNFTDGPAVIDGPYPRILEAVVRGVITAKQTLIDLHTPHVKVGFNATPTFGRSENFWANLAATADACSAQHAKSFSDSLDYVALDFFPDVFRPAAPDGQPGDLSSSTLAVLETMRTIWLPSAKISASTPIHITESGWPTGPTRTPDQQSAALEKVVRTIHSARARINIARYTLFSLRDVTTPTPSNESSLFPFFGITTADYSPSPPSPPSKN